MNPNRLKGASNPDNMVPHPRWGKILVLRHIEFPHTEEWYQMDDGNIFVVGHYPWSYPSKANTILSPVQALRQYALLTCENWKVHDHKSDWHTFVESSDYRKILMVGNISDGHHFFGPFGTSDEANEFADNFPDHNWWFLDLEDPITGDL